MMQLTKVMLADKNGRRMDTYTYEERKAMAVDLHIGTIAVAYLAIAREERHTDVQRHGFPAINQRPCEPMTGSSRIPASGLDGQDSQGTTGHHVDPEKSRSLARRTLISTLAHQERHRAHRKSESQPEERVHYENGEAWSFDTQEYSKSSQGYQQAATLIDHNTGIPFSAYQIDKDDDTFLE
jgi:hypothetical protein